MKISLLDYLLSLIVVIVSQVVVSTVAKNHQQALTKAVFAVPKPSGTPAFPPHSGVLGFEALSASACGLERAPARPAIAPPL